MKIIRVTYFALVAFLSAASCSKEAAEPGVYDWADGKIYFKTSLADVAYSRAQDMTLDNLESFQVTCFNTGDITKDETAFVIPYFEDATFIRNKNSAFTTYVSSPDEELRQWPANDGVITFFAFSPSRSVMAAGNSALNDTHRYRYFNLINSSTATNSTIRPDYRLGIIRINPDISRQFDFVTAQASGERWKDFSGGVELAFSHQLCQVELRAWGNGSEHDFEIAGVRLGNPVVEGTYIFADDEGSANAGRWATQGETVKDKVEYIYRGSGALSSINQPVVGDRIFRINSRQHNTQKSAASIMGNGGCAMVIPTVNMRWEGTDDNNVDASLYKTDKMYFSILLRATDSATGETLYPYPGNANGMNVIYYAVDRSGTIISRVFPGEKEGTFFIDPNLRIPCAPAEGVEIKDFGWAAVPVDADWSAGKRYIYTLDYSEGIGLHDPDDPDPGKPIGATSSISWGISVGGWDYATPDDNYTPDLNVPEKE